MGRTRALSAGRNLIQISNYGSNLDPPADSVDDCDPRGLCHGIIQARELGDFLAPNNVDLASFQGVRQYALRGQRATSG
jgi:hypothetical protein